ncbi:MAG: riboflavin biosynthesis protein RibF [Candidatus Promineifilaceae bacterium]
MSWQHVEHISDVTERVPTVLAIGNFDGVHLGHQAVLKSVVEAAHAIGARPAALTFFPHPREIIRGDMSRYYLMPLADRVARLADNGIELVISHPFNEAVRHTRAASFVQQMVDYLDLRQLWGGNFSLGYKREGDFAFLSAQGTQHGFSVHLFDSVLLPLLRSVEGVETETISSSRIRRSLRAGDVREAARCLGHPYAVHGPILLGKQLGRTIGIPTANVGVWDRQLLPAYGVYATRVWVAGEAFIGATNVGVRPTVDGSTHVTVEPHILDFDRDIYDQEVTVEFIERVRDEQKFSGLGALKVQITKDIEAVRQIMARE